MKRNAKIILSFILSTIIISLALPISNFNACAQSDNLFGCFTVDHKQYITMISNDFQGDELVIPSTLYGCPVAGIESMAFAGRSGIKSVIIETGLEIIGQGAFENCFDLESVVLPDTVKEIWPAAFLGCTKLKGITIPDSVTSIGSQAFSGCKLIESVNISKNVTSIDVGAFSGCNALKSITVANDNPVYHSCSECLIKTDSNSLIAVCNNSEIPADGSVTEIAEYTFLGLDIEKIVIPKSVTRIKGDAFNWCENLKRVYYGGSRNEMSGISIDYYLNDSLLNADWYCNYSSLHCKAGDINGDDEVNNKDLTRLFQYHSNWEVEVNEIVLDVNSDESIDNKDLARLFQYLSNWDVEVSFDPSIPERVVVPDEYINPKTGFRWPVDGNFGVSRTFGNRIDGYHNGIDIAGSGIFGRPIFAVADGIVIKVVANWNADQGTSENNSFGNYCAINHGALVIGDSSAEYVSYYANVGSISVTEGREVKKGEIIGWVGTTGDATSPRLHIGIQRNGLWVNPYPLLVE